MKAEITAIIVDDEQLSIDIILEFLKDFPQVNVIGSFRKSSEAVGKIIALKPTLLFLDIQMPVLNGFDIIENIIGTHNPYIIFTTAYDQYAIKAFEVNAIGYLLKPFDREKFAKAMARFESGYASNAVDDTYNRILRILEAKQKESRPDHIMIKDAKRVFFLPITEISYFEAAGDYVKVVCDRNSHLINDSLSHLENKFASDFIRIHRSHLVNRDCIKEFIPYFNGEYQVVMQNGDQLKMSRNYKDNLKAYFPGL
ncbi:LytR/AlgR family response regulator transcription factor [Flavobacterium pallidum]|uniref:DNA-binding response regulator n=1 Tax=Flavobacterium pallidum TaxID=2172098 RepID=A0A2S1SIG5_9FLAO|nr:LytTR family transcriptional regulator DNA-binding domain-containing protein [Flavobacterium pallidum]AWI26137.1 DNA-binding response regulator [Flavobacterium pallidum]